MEHTSQSSGSLQLPLSGDNTEAEENRTVLNSSLGLNDEDNREQKHATDKKQPQDNCEDSKNEAIRDRVEKDNSFSPRNREFQGQISQTDEGNELASPDKKKSPAPAKGSENEQSHTERQKLESNQKNSLPHCDNDVTINTTSSIKEGDSPLGNVNSAAQNSIQDEYDLEAHRNQNKFDNSATEVNLSTINDYQEDAK